MSWVTQRRVLARQWRGRVAEQGPARAWRSRPRKGSSRRTRRGWLAEEGAAEADALALAAGHEAAALAEERLQAVGQASRGDGPRSATLEGLRRQSVLPESRCRSGGCAASGGSTGCTPGSTHAVTRRRARALGSSSASSSTLRRPPAGRCQPSSRPSRLALAGPRGRRRSRRARRRRCGGRARARSGDRRRRRSTCSKVQVMPPLPGHGAATATGARGRRGRCAAARAGAARWPAGPGPRRRRRRPDRRSTAATGPSRAGAGRRRARDGA